MPLKKPTFQLIESQAELDVFYKQNKEVRWLSFDTEFVGEKRFVTRLCLLQIATQHGNYLIDPFQISDLSPVLELIQKEHILKITHAGDNDYRLLNNLYGIIPKNLFDTQIAAGFVGYKYPVSFRKLVESELRIYLDKGYAVTDWESRPFLDKQLNYALEDVLPLYALWQSLEGHLNRHQRLHWAREEFERMESPDFYYKDPNQEALSSDLIKSLNTKEQIFLIRLMDWRRRVASEKNYSKEMILPGKLLSHLVRSISSGQDALRRNRRLPEKLIRQHGDFFEQLYRQPATPEEQRLLSLLPSEESEDPFEEILLETLYLLVKYKCFEHGIPPGMVIARNAIKKIRSNGVSLEGWRKELLGEGLVERILNFDKLDMKVSESDIALVLVEE